jgi:hypothetical protein
MKQEIVIVGGNGRGTRGSPFCAQRIKLEVMMTVILFVDNKVSKDLMKNRAVEMVRGTLM